MRGVIILFQVYKIYDDESNGYEMQNGQDGQNYCQLCNKNKGNKTI